MNKYKRDENSGAAVLADRATVDEFLQKKSTVDTVEALKAEINRLRQDMEDLRNSLAPNEKR